MQEAFNVFDEDGDGFISAEELKAVLEKLGLVEGESIDRVQIMICSVDQDHDGRVDFGEFKIMMKSIDVESSWLKFFFSCLTPDTYLILIVVMISDSFLYSSYVDFTILSSLCDVIIMGQRWSLESKKK